MEAYDICSVQSRICFAGSMVVYEKESPNGTITGSLRSKAQGADDYASMEEVLTRRFTHGLKEQEEGKELGGFTAFPDLILMDGGRGQVNIALQVLRKSGA